jgi:hypothetical protein
MSFSWGQATPNAIFELVDKSIVETFLFDGTFSANIFGLGHAPKAVELGEP